MVYLFKKTLVIVEYLLVCIWNTFLVTSHSILRRSKCRLLEGELSMKYAQECLLGEEDLQLLPTL